MQVSRWGNSLAVRLPAKLVAQLGLREGDEVELRPVARTSASAPFLKWNGSPLSVSFTTG